MSIDKCANCGWFGPVAMVRADSGDRFFGEPVYDDLLLCQLCQDTLGMKGDRLIRYIGNLLLQKLEELHG